MNGILLNNSPQKFNIEKWGSNVFIRTKHRLLPAPPSKLGTLEDGRKLASVCWSSLWGISLPNCGSHFFSDVLNQSSTSKHRFWAIFQKKLVCCSEMCFLENLFSHKHFFDKYIFKVAGLRVCLLYKSKLFVWISFLLEKSECSSHIQKCCLFILSSKG